MAISPKTIPHYWIWSSLVFGTLLLALASLTSAQKSAAKKDQVPRIQLSGRGELLILPEKLSQLIREHLTGFRVPEPKDCTGNWDQDTDAGNLPYAVWGDFQGRGRTDVALILLGNREWKLAVFHQHASGFNIAYSNRRKIDAPDALVRSPQTLSLKLVAKGKPYVLGTISKAGKEEQRYSFAVDAIEFSGLETFLSLRYWKEGKYQSMDFSD